MLPRLQAEEALASFSIGRMSFGFGAQRDLDQAIRELETAAGSTHRRARKARPETLAAIGIATVIAPPRTGEASDG